MNNSIVSRKRFYKKSKLKNAILNKCKCRTAGIYKENYVKIKMHEKIKLDFECIYCHDPSKIFYTHCDDFFYGIAAECKCKNFIIYYDKNIIMKFELYIDDLNIYIINALDGYYESFTNDKDSFIMKTPYFYFYNIDCLKEKIKKYILLS